MLEDKEKERRNNSGASNHIIEKKHIYISAKPFD
jgi:hypothetical protein